MSPVPTSLVLTPVQFRDAITLVKPFICTDETLPSLCGFRFEVARSDLYVLGTDRYTLAVARVAASEEQAFPDGFAAFVPASLATRALALFKVPRRAAPLAEPLRISTHGEWTSIENVPHGDEPPTRLVGHDVVSANKVGFRLTFSESSRLVGQAIDLWRETQKATEQAPPTVGLNPAFTARLAAVQKIFGDGAPVVMRAGHANKPVLFTHGEDFIALQMPVRIDFEGNVNADFDAWAARFAPEPVVEKKPRKRTTAKPRARKAKSA